MKGLRSVSYFCYRCFFCERVPECVPGWWRGANHALKRMSHNTPCLKNNLPQTKESPRDLEEFGRVTVKEKPLLRSLADFADSSPVLQKLIDLGVEVYRFEEDWDFCKFLLNLDFNENIRPYITFLGEHGVGQEALGSYLTENPYILMCDLDDLQVRINYLQSKCFTRDMIADIITGNPKWLSFEVKRIDKALGNIQKNFKMTGDDVRLIAWKYPRIMNVTREKLELNIILFKEQLQLPAHEQKKLLTKKPVLLARDPNETMLSFYFIQDIMKVPVHLIIEQPEILVRKVHFLKVRHNFLVKLGRAQYDTKLPGYVSLENFATMDDEMFCKTVAMTDVSVFHKFQKTL